MTETKPKVALITGVTGTVIRHMDHDQDKTAVILLNSCSPRGMHCDIDCDDSYVVHGVVRRSSTFNTGRIEGIFSNTSMYDMYFIVLQDSICIMVI